MAYVFQTDKTAQFKFRTNDAEHGGGAGAAQMTTLKGINATLASAESICAGVDSLMAIGGNVPYYTAGDSKRTVIQVVDDY